MAMGFLLHQSHISFPGAHEATQDSGSKKLFETYVIGTLNHHRDSRLKANSTYRGSPGI